MSSSMFGAGIIDRLHETATAHTGLEDFGGSSYLEALEVLTTAYDQDADFTELGAEYHFGALVGALAARLFSQSAWSQHPGHADVRIERPVIITGVARTGTTALNRLLCAPAEHQGLDLWLANVPMPRPPRETWPQHPVFQMIDAKIKETPYSRPEFAHIHFVAADAPEECDLLSQQSFMGNMWVATANVPTYAKWLAEQDWVPALERNRKNLQLIGMTVPDKRWVLKNPGHLHNLDELLRVYPDALVIWTHRAPETCIPSISSVLEKLVPGQSHTYEGALIGQGQLDYYATGVEKAMAARARHDEAQFLDVYYDEFVASPMATVERVYDRLGESLTDDARTAVRAADEASHLGHRDPNHHYELADYGLSQAAIDERFGAYLEAHPQVRSTTR
ncbi:sulfotransferase [Nocardioides sp. JQ2195]|uniref:sulfotransferase family protein n=1 Tax=Nocardioides sp. JQ2195 TaxID=2592334 RepID=UPI00143E9D80|nr:sulfotransferase [Nocardioides sp. JQ2195]QIX26500.1 sulfotransferase [Nocardioides sp. JQ2195]